MFVQRALLAQLLNCGRDRTLPRDRGAMDTEQCQHVACAKVCSSARDVFIFAGSIAHRALPRST